MTNFNSTTSEEMKAITNENNQTLNPKDCFKEIFEIDLPDIPVFMIGSAGIHDFPNINTNSAKWLIFIKENGSVTRNDLFDKFGTSSYIGVFRSFDIIKWNMADDTYSLTEYGENMVKLVNWFAPVYELIDFVKNAEIENVDELDIQLTISGKRSLISKDVLIKINMIYHYGVLSLGNDTPLWLKRILSAVSGAIHMHETVFSELFNKYALCENAA